MKRLINKVLRRLGGYELNKVNNVSDNGEGGEIGSHHRPVGNMDYLMEDLNKRGFNPKCILDVGANHTLWSRLAKRVFPNANLFLIEPQIELKKHLDRFVKEFTDSTYILAGAGAKPDVLTLTLHEDLGGSSFLPEVDDNLKKSGKQREIKIITIDDLITSSQLKMPELVKLDIQGFELEALKGASKTFGYTEVYIMEVSLFSLSDLPAIPVFSDVVNFMLERGYVVYDFPGFLRRPLDGALTQCDICFVKKDSFLRSSNDWA